MTEHPVLAWVDGEVVAATTAVVPALDAGLRSGIGVFETMRATDGRIAHRDEHVARAVAGAAALGFALDARTIGRALDDLIDADRHRGPREGAWARPERVVRLTATAGPVTDDAEFPPPLVGRPTIVVTLHPAPPLPRPAAHAVTVDVARSLPHLKTTSYVAAHVASAAAIARGADVALIVHDGRLLEAANGNVLLLTGRELATPPVDAGILAGVTRGAVLAVAARAEVGLEVRERDIGVDELHRADAVLVCSSVVGLRDVDRVDGEAVGLGAPGASPAARSIVERLRAALATDASPAPHGARGPQE